MSYEKQTWNKYDDLKTEEENIENGAVVTDNRMNHIEEGIGDNNTNLASHLANTNNPHKVTAVQVGLDKVDNVKQASKVEFDSHTSDNSNPHKVTAAQIGLDKVDNIQQAAKTDFDSHVNNKANPHSVTASQVGTYTKQEIDTKLSKTVMADDSGKVTVSNTIDSGQVKTATIQTGYGRSAVITRIGNTVTITSQNRYTIAPANETWLRNVATLPLGYRPVEDVLIYNHDLSNGSKFSWSLLHPSGVIDLFSSGNITTIDYILSSGQFWITKDELPS